MRIGTLVVALVGLSMAAAACGDDDASDPGVADGPSPAEMCAEGGEPALAAYDRATGEYQWSVCSQDPLYRIITGVSDEAVHLDLIAQNSGSVDTIAYSMADGSEISAAPPASDAADPVVTFSPEGIASVEVDGIRLVSGQDDPTSAFDVGTGEQLWTAPGSLAYDDVWAVGDGAIYVMDLSDPAGPRLIAYEIASGDVRWERPAARGDVVWPWTASDDELFAMWTNLDVMSTEDGTTIWRTNYPPTQFPRMTGVAANDDTVFVASSSIPSGGD